MSEDGEDPMFPRQSSRALDALAHACRQEQLEAVPSLRRRFARWYGPHLARQIEGHSAAPARAKLKVEGGQALLVDSSVSHERRPTRFVSYWEDYEDSANYTAILRTQEIPVGDVRTDSKDVRFSKNENRKYLPGIATLAREGRIRLYTSWEMSSLFGIEGRMSRDRFRVREDIFHDIEIQEIDNSDPFHSEAIGGTLTREVYCTTCDAYAHIVVGSPASCPTCAGTTMPGSFRRRTDRRKDRTYMEPPADTPRDPEISRRVQKMRDATELNARFVELLSVFKPGRGHDWDYLHLATAEVNGIDVYLTLDGKFVRHVRNRMRSKRSKPVELRSEVLTPYEWATRWGVLPVETPRLLGELAGRRTGNPYWTAPISPKTEEQVKKRLMEKWP